MNFWNKLPKPFFALAPMEDVTDVVFRQVIERAAPPDAFFTEFMNVSGFCHPEGKKNVARRLRRYESDLPLVAQIWGKNPEDFANTAKELSSSFSGIDINMGCPDKSVIKAGGGSALIKNPELAVKIINSVKSCKQNIALSVKTRLGYSNIDESQSWLIILLEQNLDAITIHLRTRKEMSKVPAHHELIPKIVRLRNSIAPNTKLIINGDIRDREHGEEIVRQNPGVDGIMIGRGVFANPYCFENRQSKHSKENLIELLRYHLDTFDAQEKEVGYNPKYEILKKFFKIYINNFAGASDLRSQLMSTKSTNEARKVMSELN